MTTIARQTEYLQKLNKLNKEFGLAIKYDPRCGSYYIEDQVDHDFEYIDYHEDSSNDYRTEFALN